MYKKVELYINTVKYLKFSQIYYRLRNKLKRELYKRKISLIKIVDGPNVKAEVNFILPELDFSRDYLLKFDINEIMQNKFSFINIIEKVDLKEAWNNPSYQHLWRYNLHYFEYGYSLAYEHLNCAGESKYYIKFKYFVENWIDNNPISFGDGWHPYTVSLRLTNWISLYSVFEKNLKLDKTFNDKFKKSMHIQYKYLQNNLEKDVLGNHYFENIKAMIIGSIFFDENIVKEKFIIELKKQLKEQVLEDGIYFELSPMYHNIILEDLIKITYWLKDQTIYNYLIVYIKKMIDVTYSLEDSFGKMPAFNDSTDGISKNYKNLIDICYKYFNIKPQFSDSFENGGFYIIKDINKKIIFDTGDICPSYLPAHGQCDSLSFELSLNNKPMIVNSGTCTYQDEKWRNHFRNTRAHNTVLVNGAEQSQCWGSFRVAKRIKNIRRKKFNYKNICFFAGEYSSYSGIQHKRYIGNIDEDKIIVLDYVNIRAEDIVTSYLHFMPGSCLKVENNTVSIIKGISKILVTPIGVSKLEIEKSVYSKEFNIKEENEAICLVKNTDSVYFGYLISLNSDSSDVYQSGNKLRINSNKEIIIDYEELGDIF